VFVRVAIYYLVTFFLCYKFPFGFLMLFLVLISVIFQIILALHGIIIIFYIS